MGIISYISRNANILFEVGTLLESTGLIVNFLKDTPVNFSPIAQLKT